MSTYKTEGIIIKRNNFLESSLILNIYTKDYGKVEAVARSARKAKGKLKGHLELFLDVDLVLAHGKNIDTITSSLTINSFSNLRNNIEFSFGAYYILELVDKITAEGHRDERVFYLLKRMLLFLDELANDERNANLLSSRTKPQRRERSKNTVNTANFALRSLSRYRSFGMTKKKNAHFIIQSNLLNILILLFQTNLLNLTGFSPELNKCVLCGKPIKAGKNYFGFSVGGVVGNECVSQKESPGRCEPSLALGIDASEGSHLPIFLSDNAIKLLRLFQFKGGGVKEYNLHLNKCFKIIGKLKVDEKLVLDSVFLMNRFIEFNIERKIKGVDFLKF